MEFYIKIWHFYAKICFLVSAPRPLPQCLKIQFSYPNTDVFTFIFCLILFLPSDHQTFCSLFKIRRHDIVCINHEIVIGLCSELLMRLFYYIHPGYGKKFFVSQRGLIYFLPNVSHQLYPWTKAVTLLKDKVEAKTRLISSKMNKT